MLTAREGEVKAVSARGRVEMVVRRALREETAFGCVVLLLIMLLGAVVVGTKAHAVWVVRNRAAVAAVRRLDFVMVHAVRRERQGKSWQIKGKRQADATY